MIYELNHLGIVVEDLAASVDFYTSHLGAAVVWSAHVEASGMDLAYLQVAQGLVELLYFPDGAMPLGTNHLGFYSDDLDADYARLVAAGAASLVAPKVAGTGAGRQALVTDPDGVAIELLQRDLPLRAGTLPHPHIRAIDHVALQASDHDRIFAFYTDHLGMSVAKQLPIPQLDTHLTYLHHGADVVEILPEVHDGPRLHHLALIVDDVAAALAYAEERGATIHEAAHPAAGGVGSVGALIDPDQTVIEFIDRPPVLAG